MSYYYDYQNKKYILKCPDCKKYTGYRNISQIKRASRVCSYCKYCKTFTDYDLPLPTLVNMKKETLSFKDKFIKSLKILLNELGVK